jgi:hypothetical protein
LGARIFQRLVEDVHAIPELVEQGFCADVLAALSSPRNGRLEMPLLVSVNGTLAEAEASADVPDTRNGESDFNRLAFSVVADGASRAGH